MSNCPSQTWITWFYRTSHNWSLFLSPSVTSTGETCTGDTRQLEAHRETSSLSGWLVKGISLTTAQKQSLPEDLTHPLDERATYGGLDGDRRICEACMAHTAKWAGQLWNERLHAGLQIGPRRCKHQKSETVSAVMSLKYHYQKTGSTLKRGIASLHCCIVTLHWSARQWEALWGAKKKIKGYHRVLHHVFSIFRAPFSPLHHVSPLEEHPEGHFVAFSCTLFYLDGTLSCLVFQRGIKHRPFTVFFYRTWVHQGKLEHFS